MMLVNRLKRLQQLQRLHQHRRPQQQPQEEEFQQQEQQQQKKKMKEAPEIPYHFRCPISLELMQEPVTLCTGITYERRCIEKWLKHSRICPASMQQLWSLELLPNHTLSSLIQEWRASNETCSFNRRPGSSDDSVPLSPPKNPLDRNRALELLQKLPSSSVIKMIRGAAKESERNRVFLASSSAFSMVGEAMANLGKEESETCLEDLENCAAILLLLLPNVSIDDEIVKLKEKWGALLQAISCVLRWGSYEGKVNAVSFIQNILKKCNRIGAVKVEISETKGLLEGIVELVRDKFYDKAVRCGLSALCIICRDTSELIICRAVQAGAVSALLELLPDASKRNAEITLEIVEMLCECREGREALRNNALTVASLVGSVLSVSDGATEHAVGALWILFVRERNEYKCKDDESALYEAVEQGAFNQLLLLMQADKSNATKYKTRDLLKLLRHTWNRHPCAPALSALLSVI